MQTLERKQHLFFEKLSKRTRRHESKKQAVTAQLDEEKRQRKRKLQNEQAYELNENFQETLCEEPLAIPMSIVLHELQIANDPHLVYTDLIANARRYLAYKEVVDYGYLSKAGLFRLWEWQEETLHFVEERECDEAGLGCRGLMLCLEMGLGKAIVSLSHILRENQRCYLQTGNRYNGCTLIVCQNVLLVENWLYEARTKWPPASFQWYRLSSSKNRYMARCYIENCCDFVIVTYATINAAYKYKLKQITPNQVIDDEEEDDEEEEEEEEEEEAVVLVKEESGSKRRALDEKEYKYDILYNVRWKRIIADESHYFVNKRTLRYRAMLALNSSINWAVTGTPIQNSLSDICSNFNFIGVPMARTIELGREFILSEAEEQCIRDTLKIVMVRRLKTEVQALTTELTLFMPVIKTIKLLEFESLQEKVIYYLYAAYGSRNWKNIQQQEEEEEGEQETPIRGTMTSVASVLQLMMQLCIGSRIVNELVLPHGLLTLGHEKQLKLKPTAYKEALFERGTSEMSFDTEDNTLEYFASRLSKQTLFEYKSGSASVLNLPSDYRVDYHRNLASDASSVSELDGEGRNNESFIWDPFQESKYFDLETKHDATLYQSLYERMASEEKSATELVQEAKQKKDKKQEAMVKHLGARVLRPIHYSTKNRHIIKYIQSIPADDKVIVFSNSIKGLESLGYDLEAQSISSILVSGGTHRDNDDRIARFKDPHSEIKVLLLSFKLGNVGLNITCANHMLFLQPWWNPHMTDQAENRIHRLGQTKPVFIVYFIMNRTIDLYVLNLSHDKKNMTSSLIGQNENEKLQVERYAYNLYEYAASQNRLRVQNLNSAKLYRPP